MLSYNVKNNRLTSWSCHNDDEPDSITIHARVLSDKEEKLTREDDEVNLIFNTKTAKKLLKELEDAIEDNEQARGVDHNAATL